MCKNKYKNTKKYNKQKNATITKKYNKNCKKFDKTKNTNKYHKNAFKLKCNKCNKYNKNTKKCFQN